MLAILGSGLRVRGPGVRLHRDAEPGVAHAGPEEVQEEEGEVQGSRWSRGEVPGSSTDLRCLWRGLRKQDLPDQTYEEPQPKCQALPM